MTKYFKVKVYSCKQQNVCVCVCVCVLGVEWREPGFISSNFCSFQNSIVKILSIYLK